MVQKATGDGRKPRRGRPPGFDRERVIHDAITAFWSSGNGTRLSHIEEATGVDRSTLYNSFGGKDGLYDSAKAAYLDRAEQSLFGPLYSGNDGLADIVAVLTRLRHGLIGDGSGCLIVNNMADPANESTTQRYLDLVSGGFEAALRRAAGQGQIDDEDIGPREAVLTAFVVGINQVSNSPAHRRRISSMVDGMVTQVHSWRR